MGPRVPPSQVGSADLDGCERCLWRSRDGRQPGVDVFSCNAGSDRPIWESILQGEDRKATVRQLLQQAGQPPIASGCLHVGNLG